MEEQQPQTKPSQRRARCIVTVAVFVAIVLIVALVLGLTLRTGPVHGALERVFMGRCEARNGHDCLKIWREFEGAFMGRDPCTVTPEAYDPVLSAAPFESACNMTLFWSRAKGVVHDLTEKRSCHVTLEDTLLGSVLDGLTWCSKEGSNEAFTSDCPGWFECENNPVRSFWRRASALYAEKACGNVYVMLNGSTVSPFSNASVFGSVEVKYFNPDVMESLNVVLVTRETEVSNCTNASLMDLQNVLPQGIAYSCQEVQESSIEACASKPEIPCDKCW